MLSGGCFLFGKMKARLPAWAASTAATGRSITARRAALEDFFRLAFCARDFRSRRLIDDLHRQAGLTAIIKAQELDVNILAFFDDFTDGRWAAIGELRDVDEAIFGTKEVHERAL